VESAAAWCWLTPEPHRRLIDNLPARLADFNRTPPLIAQVDVDRAGQFRDTAMRFVLHPQTRKRRDGLDGNL
jgi:hypothetical protein